jgi:hypothetical protein
MSAYHGLRSVRLRRTALHPWLHPVAPVGGEDSGVVGEFGSGRGLPDSAEKRTSLASPVRFVGMDCVAGCVGARKHPGAIWLPGVCA